MSRRNRFDIEPRDAREPEWLARLEEASYRGQLTQADGAELLEAVQYLRRELAAAQCALEWRAPPPPGTSKDEPTAIQEPIGDHVAEWMEAQRSRVSRLMHGIFGTDQRESLAAALELRRVNWLVLGHLWPGAMRLEILRRQWEAYQMPVATITVAQMKAAGLIIDDPLPGPVARMREVEAYERSRKDFPGLPPLDAGALCAEFGIQLPDTKEKAK